MSFLKKKPSAASEIDTFSTNSTDVGTAADVEEVMAPRTITRVDQSRRITISGDTISGDSTAPIPPPVDKIPAACPEFPS